MRLRKVLVAIFLAIVGLLLEAPIALIIGDICISTYRSGGQLQAHFLGFNSSAGPPWPLARCPTFLRNRFYGAFSRPVNGKPKRSQFIVESIDSPTSESYVNNRSEVASQELPSSPGWRLQVFGDASHMWVVGQMSEAAAGRFEYELYEVKGNTLVGQAPMPAKQQRPMAFPEQLPDGRWYEFSDQLAFVLDGKLSSIIEDPTGRRELYQLIGGKWVSRGEIELLDTKRNWQDASGKVLLSRYVPRAGWALPALGLLEVLPIGSTNHLFWRVPGKLLHRRNMAILPKTSSTFVTQIFETTDSPTSASEPDNADGTTTDWQLVSDQISNGFLWFPVIVGGAPAIVVIDESKKGYPKARAFRQESGEWSEFSSIDLPFSSVVTKIGSCEDGSSALFAATTHSNRGLLVAIEPSGFRNTEIRYSERPHGVEDYIRVAFLFVWSLITGTALGLVTTICMWRDRATYDFGHESVGLASVAERGFARLIDFFLLLLAAFSPVVGSIFVFDLDWRTAAEASTIQVYDHPSYLAARYAAMACFFCLAAGSLTLIAMQGSFSMTPGKWICRLRTVRTTLRPCGFAPSLMRELLLCFDSFYLLCWMPGLLSIACTDNRQRIGDRLADTIVIRASSRDREEKSHELSAELGRRIA